MFFFRMVLLIPVINVVANITTNYFPPATLNPGLIRVFYIIFLLLLYFRKYRPAQKNLFGMVLVFLIYNFYLVLLNKNHLLPLISYAKFSLPILLFFVGYSVVTNKFRLEMLLKANIIALSFFVLNYIVANILGLGDSFYLRDSFYVGGAGAGSVNELAIYTIICVCFLFLNKKNKWNKFAILLIAISFILILLSMRRGAFLTLGVSLIIYFYIHRLNSKTIKYFFLGFTVLIIAFPFYGNTLIERYKFRSESRGGSLTNIKIEARFLEFQIVPTSLTRENKWLTGINNMNSSKYFWGRELHVGYMAILHGSGLIGLTIFLSIFLVLINKGILIYSKIAFINNKNIKDELYLLCALYFSLIFGLLTCLISSRFHSFGVTVPSFLVMGGVLSYFYNYR